MLCDILQRGTLTYFPTRPGSNPDVHHARDDGGKRKRRAGKDMARRLRERGRRNGGHAGGMGGEKKEGRQAVKKEGWRKENWRNIGLYRCSMLIVQIL